MKDTKEYNALCDEIDELLVSILKDSREYIAKKEAFYDVWREVLLCCTC